LGLATALILKPTAAYKFQVVEETYHSGVMEREALLGPLPDGINAVIRYSPVSAQSHVACFDRNNNIVTTVDPRLGDMPPGWRLESNPEDEILQWFMNEETGEKQYKDPRPTLELLKKRGVDLQFFDLI